MDNKWNPYSVVYHIYVRSFKDTNSDGVGDLQGVIERLNYLNGNNKISLGVDAIWLSPIYVSPQADFGYDVADYYNIDPIYGDFKTFKTLIKEAHNRGIKIMMDFVPNHTSSNHLWFKESKSDKKNPKRDYYIWKDPKTDGSPPNNWRSVFGGSAWEYDELSKQYYLHTFDTNQPDLNWHNPEVVKEMQQILRFWLEVGVDGFRVDAIEWMVKDPQFEDEPENLSFMAGNDPYHMVLHTKTFALPELTILIKELVEPLNDFKDKFMVIEVWSGMEEMIKWYNRIEKQWFTPFNFGIITLPWKVSVHREFIDKYDRSVGFLYIPTYVTGNHDQPRIASRIGKEAARVAAMLVLTLRGMAYIYNGDEIGMTNTEIPSDKIMDPFEKKTPGLGLGRDPERTPIQWNEESQAGFTESDIPWLPINPDYKEVNVRKENNDPHSILSLYKALIHLRKNHPSLQYGSQQVLKLNKDQVFGFLRIYEGQMVLVLLNYGSQKEQVITPFNSGKILLDTNLKKIDQVIKLSKLTLGPFEGLTIELNL
jgi:alpha-glucosidase